LRHAVLPPALTPRVCGDLKRLGRNHDGGYLVSAADIAKTEVLFGLGINDDWSFEREFVACQPCAMFGYDASVDAGYFLNKALKGLVRPKKLPRAISVLIDYHRFFTGNHKHVKKFVGLDIGGEHVGFGDIVSRAAGRMSFFKIDIEGSEYRILDDLVALRTKISGLVIEFHDCDLNLDRITDFVERIGLPIVHVHANNYAPVDDKGLPLVLEITFSRFAELQTGTPNFPHPLDMANNRKAPEIILTTAT
jgi:hypothetical protein